MWGESITTLSLSQERSQVCRVKRGGRAEASQRCVVFFLFQTSIRRKSIIAEFKRKKSLTVFFSPSFSIASGNHDTGAEEISAKIQAMKIIFQDHTLFLPHSQFVKSCFLKKVTSKGI